MRILIVDDETNIRKSLRIALESMKHAVEEAVSPADASKRIEDAPFDVAFVDLRLRDESGLDLIETLTKRSPRLAIVIITAYASIDSAVDAMRRGAFDYLPKPFTPDQLRVILERLRQVRKLRNQVADLVIAKSIDVKFADIVQGVVDEELADIVFPKGEREPACSSVLIGEIQAIVVVADVLGAVPVIDAVVVQLPVHREPTGMVVDHVEGDRNAVDMTQIDQRLQLRGSRSNVLETERRNASEPVIDHPQVRRSWL